MDVKYNSTANLKTIFTYRSVNPLPTHMLRLVHDAKRDLAQVSQSNSVDVFTGAHVSSGKAPTNIADCQDCLDRDRVYIVAHNADDAFYGYAVVAAIDDPKSERLYTYDVPVDFDRVQSALTTGFQNGDGKPVLAIAYDDRSSHVLIRGTNDLQLEALRALRAIEKSYDSARSVQPLCVARYGLKYPLPLSSDGGGTNNAIALASAIAQSLPSAYPVAVVPAPDGHAIAITGRQDRVAKVITIAHQLDKAVAQIDFNVSVYEVDLSHAVAKGFQLPDAITITSAAIATPSPLFRIGDFKFPPGPAINVLGQLAALETTGYARVVAQGHVATVSGRPATVSFQQQVPFTNTVLNLNAGTLSTNSAVAPYQAGTSTTAAGMILAITPMVSQDAGGTRVAVWVHPKVTSLQALDRNGQPVVFVDETASTVVIDSQTAVVIAGIHNHAYARNLVNSPYFGDHGNPFAILARGRSERELDSEYIVVIRPSTISQALPHASPEVLATIPPPKPFPTYTPFFSPTQSPVLRTPSNY